MLGTAAPNMKHTLALRKTPTSCPSAHTTPPVRGRPAVHDNTSTRLCWRSSHHGRTTVCHPRGWAHNARHTPAACFIRKARPHSGTRHPQDLVDPEKERHQGVAVSSSDPSRSDPASAFTQKAATERKTGKDSSKLQVLCASGAPPTLPISHPARKWDSTFAMGRCGRPPWMLPFWGCSQACSSKSSDMPVNCWSKHGQTWAKRITQPPPSRPPHMV